MEADILAYLNEKEFPTRTYLCSSWIHPSPPFSRLLEARHVFPSICLSLLVVGQTSSPDATRSIASVEGVIDVLPA